MVLILPSETRINLRQVCTYYYRSGQMNFHLSSGPTVSEYMDLDKAVKLLLAIDSALDGANYVNPPPKQTVKKNERSSTASTGLDSKPTGRPEVSSGHKGMEVPI